MARKRGTTDAVAVLRRRYVDGDPEMAAAPEAERVNADVAQMIYDLRTEAGFSQAELAERIGTTQSAISRLEAADYHGRSMSVLIRVAAALGRRLEVRMPPRRPRRRPEAQGVGARRGG